MTRRGPRPSARSGGAMTRRGPQSPVGRFAVGAVIALLGFSLVIAPLPEGAPA